MQQQSSLAIVFPGQGAQHIGMLGDLAKEFPLIGETFQEAEGILGRSLWLLAQEGPEEHLHHTMNAQPIMLTAGVALWRLWQSKKGANPSLFAGHSLGEYTALVCAQALSFQDALNLVCERARLMQEAVPLGEGAMAAILGMDDQTLAEVCQEACDQEVVVPANFNTIGQTVIAGHLGAVERAIALAKTRGAKRALLLPVSVPSHCALMSIASEKFTPILEAVEINQPKIPVIHNENVKASETSYEIRGALVRQLYSPVRWVETIQHMRALGIETIVECGPGKILSGLIKRIDPQLTVLNTDTAADLHLSADTVRLNIYYLSGEIICGSFHH